MKRKHSTKSLQEAIEVFVKELEDPTGYRISAVIEHFEVAGSEIMLRAQKTADDGGYKWVIENLNSREKIVVPKEVHDH